MLSPTFYLPFTANLILEVPDWSGNTERFGSLPNLVRELSEILDTVKALEPDAAVAGSQDIKHEDRLANAYNAARIKLDLTKVGLQQNLPFWFSE